MPPLHTLTDSPSKDLIAPHSCRYCKDILLPASNESSGDQNSVAAQSSRLLGKLSLFMQMRRKDVTNTNYNIYRHIRLLNVESQRMERLTSEGCLFYRFISEGLHRLRDKEKLRSEQGALSTTFHQTITSLEDNQNYVVVMTRAKDGQTEFILPSELLRMHSTNIPTTPRSLHGCVLALPYENDITRTQIDNPFGARTSGSFPLDRAREWLVDCSSFHENCYFRDREFIPTRLIKIYRIDNTIIMHLEDSPQPKVRYAALSYCWGGDQAVRSTKATLPLHQISIKIQNLPPTIRDAATVTEKLGIQYLWVDALCIVQDDDEERSREIKQMGRVYENAELTILASGALGAWEGFLHNFLPVCYDRPDWAFGVQIPNSRVVEPLIIAPKAFHAENCLAERAWAFQEELFSHRVLEFGSACMHWSCQTTTNCDRLTAKCQDKEMVRHEKSLCNLPDDNSDTSIYRWYHLVAMFSAKSITVARDRLPAIGGIAERFSTVLNSEYFAGIWQSSLIQDLLWMVQIDAIQSYQTRPPTYLAPSWSWASSTQAIHYDCDVLLYDGIEYKARVFEVHVTPQVEGGTYGEINYGRIVLRGSVVQAYWFLPCTPAVSDTGRIDTSPPSLPFLKIHRDAMEYELLREFPISMPVYLLVLLQKSYVNEQRRLSGLILQKKLNHYSRLGTFETYPTDYLEFSFYRFATLRTVRIV